MNVEHPNCPSTVILPSGQMDGKGIVQLRDGEAFYLTKGAASHFRLGAQRHRQLPHLRRLAAVHVRR